MSIDIMITEFLQAIVQIGLMVRGAKPKALANDAHIIRKIYYRPVLFIVFYIRFKYQNDRIRRTAKENGNAKLNFQRHDW